MTTWDTAFTIPPSSIGIVKPPSPISGNPAGKAIVSPAPASTGQSSSSVATAGMRVLNRPYRNETATS